MAAETLNQNGSNDFPEEEVVEHWRREHFIPVQKAELIDVLADLLDEKERTQFRELCRLLDTSLNLEFQGILEDLKKAYSTINPDSDKQVLKHESRSRREAKIESLFEDFDKLLKRANFQPLSHAKLQDAVGAASDWGVRLKVDFSLFDRLEVYARGDIIDTRERPKFFIFGTKKVDVPIYQRIVAIFRLKYSPKQQGSDHELVYLKLLKNIPKKDLDMMLPGGRVRMSLLDQGRIMLPTISGLVLAMVKIINKAVILAVAGFYGLIALAVFIVGTLSYGLKSFFGYKQIKTHYEYNLTKNLYYQNLDTNLGVLFRMIDEAQEQEFRETILAYFLLWQKSGEQGWTSQELDQHAERFLQDMTKVGIDFEVDDALTKVKGISNCRSRG